MLGDAKLLQLEINTLWDTRMPHDLVIGIAEDGYALRFGPRVSDVLAGKVRAAMDGSNVLDRCRAVLVGEFGEVAMSSGPSYLIPAGVTFESTETIVQSGSDLINPGNWEDDEWLDLIEGRLGPWAMAVRGSQVLAICHTPVASADAAEAGVWTHPDFRGQGLAAAVTSEWASIIDGRVLFYSTSSDNLSSQAVAKRLGLRAIGTLWKLSGPSIAEVDA